MLLGHSPDSIQWLSKAGMCGVAMFKTHNNEMFASCTSEILTAYLNNSVTDIAGSAAFLSHSAAMIMNTSPKVNSSFKCLAAYLRCPTTSLLQT